MCTWMVYNSLRLRPSLSSMALDLQVAFECTNYGGTPRGERKAIRDSKGRVESRVVFALIVFAWKSSIDYYTLFRNSNPVEHSKMSFSFTTASLMATISALEKSPTGKTC